jgi:DNA invertase Pin-like site-specific DNA recombinase
MLVGYMRISKADGSQITDPQRDALVEASVDDERLYEDGASGRRDDRPGLAACLNSLRDGDTLVVWKFDRLGRDLRHLANAVHDLTARGTGLKVLTGRGAAIDTTTAARRAGERVIATGTTVARAPETVADPDGTRTPGGG